LLASLKFGDIGDPSTHFRLLTRPNLLKLVFDAKPRLEIPRNDAITVENRQAAIDIPGHTSDGSNFMLRFIANSVEHLEHFLAICRDIYKTALGTEDATYSMLEIVARARVEFAKHYPNVNIRAEVTAAASEIQVVEKGDSHADRGRPSMNAIVTMLNR